MKLNLLHLKTLCHGSYNYQLQIRNKQQDTNEKMFKKSEDIYKNQMSINAMAEQKGIDDENRKLEEIYAEAAFDKEAAYLDSMEAEGKLRARGVVGRSSDKLAQAVAFKTGKQLTMLNLSLDNAEAASNSVLQGIKIDKNIADLNAFAAKMLDPGVLPCQCNHLKHQWRTYIYPLSKSLTTVQNQLWEQRLTQVLHQLVYGVVQ